jgi:DNA mismatch repair protein MSH6
VSVISSLKEEAFLALVTYLIRLNCAEEVIRSFKFQSYDVMKDPKYCQIDSVCLENLELVANGEDGSRRGTLLGLLDSCKLQHGKRLLRRWICHPLRRMEEINHRLDAVELLAACPSACDTFFEMLFRGSGGLTQMGDVERVFSRVVSGAAPLKAFLQFFRTCEAMTSAAVALKNAIQEEKQIDAESILLDEMLGTFPNLIELIVDCLPFDRAQAAANGKVELFPGQDPEMEEAQTERKNAEAALQRELKRIQNDYGMGSASYSHSKTERYVLTITTRDFEKREIPGDWNQLKKLKDVVKFNVPSVLELLQELVTIERRVTNMQDSLLQRLQLTLARDHRDTCLDAISRVAQIDCLISLAGFVRNTEGLCRPQFVFREDSESQMPTFIVQDMWHPYVRPSGDNFIKNDLTLGGYESQSSQPPILLVTGPNMGGKCSPSEILSN